jgi:hypothetical protein
VSLSSTGIAIALDLLFIQVRSLEMSALLVLYQDLLVLKIAIAIEAPRLFLHFFHLRLLLPPHLMRSVAMARR